MISTLSKIKVLLLALVAIIAMPSIALAQPASQSLTVSPTLIDMKANPSQSWQSEVRVINVNEYDLMIYPQVVNFAPLDESGRGNLIPVFAEETQGKTLAEWVTLSLDPIIIPRQQTVTIPLTITVPDDAAPGGHYAAILIGTKPPSPEPGYGQVQTAQFVTSLLFVRVAGDIIEAGGIREFTTTENITQTPTVGLSMRFENTGNVHLQPQGEIKITNMWGSERGIIPINHQTHFGNVLPNSIREFLFTWEGDTSPFDIGRYKAVATLGFGENEKTFSTSTTYFWVIPYTILLSILVTIILFILTASWFVRRYINHMLALQGITPGQQPYVPRHARIIRADERTVVVNSYETVTEPIRTGVEDLSGRWVAGSGWLGKAEALLSFVVQYRLFFWAVLFTILVVVGTSYVIHSIQNDDTDYSITIGNPGMAVSLSAEDVAYTTSPKTPAASTTIEMKYVLDVINTSGVNGAAAGVRIILEKAGYTVTHMDTDPNRVTDRTVIVYDPAYQDDALALSSTLDGVLLSASEELSDRGRVIVYVGRDLAPQTAE